MACFDTGIWRRDILSPPDSMASFPIPSQSAIIPYDSSPQQGDIRPSSPPSGHGAGGGVRTRDRRGPADLKADSLVTEPPTARDGVSWCNKLCMSRACCRDIS
ncbi:hypothetical protein PoB_006124700 [Plakobranchus ocellatus]|uniref:Uncharacterized protein n=1 Tax=Plakobranchus ocellatus TaxID=259542 RepID=A0AAV4CS79_9GAST|nr:hypothetical protein PoB_006124700 [Plakobranchus ocellatus]